MSVGKEYLRRIHEALAEFEEAVKQHANPACSAPASPAAERGPGAPERGRGRGRHRDQGPDAEVGPVNM